MIIKEINQIDSLKYIASNHIAKDGKLLKSINKLTTYVLHTVMENYYLKGNEKDLKGALFSWTDKAKGGYGTMKANRWLAAFEGTNIVGVQMFRLVKSIKMMWTGFVHADSKEIAYALDNHINELGKEFNVKKTYSEYSEETEELLIMEDFESKMGYRKWADANVPNHYAYYRIADLNKLDPRPEEFKKEELHRHDNRRNFLVRDNEND